MPTTHHIELTVNGVEHDAFVPSRLLLADLLRDRLELTGTHLACEHGACGACTVLFDGAPIRACLMFAVQASGHDVVTIEGIATNGVLTPIQQAFNEHHAMQCGFCTSGFIVSTTALLASQPHPDDDQIIEWLGGNLCRCTGYQNIIAAVRAAAAGDAEVVA